MQDLEELMIAEAIRQSLQQPNPQPEFEEIPAEILQIREANPNLTWEQAYRVADYHEVSNSNPNPWREKEWDIERKEISFDEYAKLAETDQDAYNVTAQKIENWEIKLI